MGTMTHRERIWKALSHEEPDRIPVDLGSTYASSITVEAYEKLKKYLGVRADTILMTKAGQAAIPDEEVLQKFDIDTRLVMWGKPDGWSDRMYPDGSYEDEWGVIRAKPEGGHYYVKKSPFEGEPSLSDLERHRWPDPHDPGRIRGLREKARDLHEHTDYAVVANLSVGVVHQSQFLRGFEGWLTDLLIRSLFAEALMDRVLSIWLDLAKEMLKAVGEYVDVVFFGDDVAFQDSPIMSLDLYRKLIKPRHKAMCDLIKSHTKAKLLFHSCGSVYPLLEDFIEVGIDVVNPVQVSAKDMDTKTLKKEFGDRLSFWGAIDTQRVLPYGTPREVEEEVRKRIEDLASGGGYVLAAVHNIQPDVGAENICAMFEAAKRWGVYPLRKG